MAEMGAGTGRGVRWQGRLGVAAALTALAMPALPAAAVAGDVVVEVGGVPASVGEVLVAICPREAFLTPNCPLNGRTEAVQGVTRVLVRRVPPGPYAVQAFHDANRNDDFDRNFIGLPLEPFGFSNDPRIRFGPPSFEESAVQVPEEPVTIRLNLIIW